MRTGRKLFAFVAIMLGAGRVPTHAHTIQVVIDKLVFSPAEINAKVGDTIEWVNKDILATNILSGGTVVLSKGRKL